MTRVLRVAVVTETYPPEINGVANTMRHLVAGLRGRGHQVLVIRPRQGADRAPAVTGPPDETLVPGLPLPGYRGLRIGLPVFWRLRRWWRAQAPDLVYIATEGPLGHAALAAARAASIPTVTGFHTQFQQYSGHYGLGLLGEPIARSLRRFHNRSDATLAPTAELRDRLTAQGFTNVQVFGRGVDTALFSPARRRADLRAQWGCGPTDPVLLHVGRLAAEKNIGLVLDAFAGVRVALPNAQCVLVGDGPELTRLRRTYQGFRFHRGQGRHRAGGALRQRGPVCLSQPDRDLRQRGPGGHGQRTDGGRLRRCRGPHLHPVRTTTASSSHRATTPPSSPRPSRPPRTGTACGRSGASGQGHGRDARLGPRH